MSISTSLNANSDFETTTTTIAARAKAELASDSYRDLNDWKLKKQIKKLSNLYNDKKLVLIDEVYLAPGYAFNTDNSEPIKIPYLFDQNAFIELMNDPLFNNKISRKRFLKKYIKEAKKKPEEAAAGKTKRFPQNILASNSYLRKFVRNQNPKKLLTKLKQSNPYTADKDSSVGYLNLKKLFRKIDNDSAFNSSSSSSISSSEGYEKISNKKMNNNDKTVKNSNNKLINDSNKNGNMKNSLPSNNLAAKTGAVNNQHVNKINNEKNVKYNATKWDDSKPISNSTVNSLRVSHGSNNVGKIVNVQPQQPVVPVKVNSPLRESKNFSDSNLHDNSFKKNQNTARPETIDDSRVIYASRNIGVSNNATKTKDKSPARTTNVNQPQVKKPNEQKPQVKETKPQIKEIKQQQQQPKTKEIKENKYQIQPQPQPQFQNKEIKPNPEQLYTTKIRDKTNSTIPNPKNSIDTTQFSNNKTQQQQQQQQSRFSPRRSNSQIEYAPKTKQIHHQYPTNEITEVRSINGGAKKNKRESVGSITSLNSSNPKPISKSTKETQTPVNPRATKTFLEDTVFDNNERLNRPLTPDRINDGQLKSDDNHSIRTSIDTTKGADKKAKPGFKNNNILPTTKNKTPNLPGVALTGKSKAKNGFNYNFLQDMSENTLIDKNLREHYDPHPDLAFTRITPADDRIWSKYANQGNNNNNNNNNNHFNNSLNGGNYHNQNFNNYNLNNTYTPGLNNGLQSPFVFNNEINRVDSRIANNMPSNLVIEGSILNNMYSRQLMSQQSNQSFRAEVLQQPNHYQNKLPPASNSYLYRHANNSYQNHVAPTRYTSDQFYLL